MAGKTIVCKQGRGLVLGGHLQAGVRVQANEFGNQANVATSIEVGVNPHLVKESRELDTESSKLHAQIRRLDPSIAFLQRQASIAALSSSIASALAQSLATRVACDARLAQIHERQAELHEELAHYRGTIDAFRAVHAGVLISIGPNARFFEDPVGRCRLKSIDGEIHVLPL
jgi:uncharacterized protein (DUF342 family)